MRHARARTSFFQHPAHSLDPSLSYVRFATTGGRRSTGEGCARRGAGRVPAEPRLRGAAEHFRRRERDAGERTTRRQAKAWRVGRIVGRPKLNPATSFSCQCCARKERKKTDNPREGWARELWGTFEILFEARARSLSCCSPVHSRNGADPIRSSAAADPRPSTALAALPAEPHRVRACDHDGCGGPRTLDATGPGAKRGSASLARPP